MIWEYHIEKVAMPSEWPIGDDLAKKWDELRNNHLEVMNKLGQERWEYFMNIGPLFYFKRPFIDKRMDDAPFRLDWVRK